MKKFGALLLVAFLVVFGFLVWWQQGTAPVDKLSTNPQVFVIEKGSGLRAITNNLKKQGLIKDPVIFFLLVKQLGLDTKIQAGDFRLSPSMSASEIAHALTKGSLDIWVTIPEGKRADEIADILKEKIPSYAEDWRTQLNQNEGYLFPDTYLIPKDAGGGYIVTLLTSTFHQKYAQVGNPRSLPQETVVTIASLIEREARHDEDRPLVSSVIHNRLDIGMKLDIDATVQYALGYQPSQKSWWKRHLTGTDLATISPYNTYKNAGLPPTPISNPGLESLQAAANPADTPYFYYFTDGQGINHYAKTLVEQEANIKKYGL
ncbi:MAG: endolytic transglycosylase MltG [bacterium]|nr:endolytic transglycosylase MltG [bacterium]